MPNTLNASTCEALAQVLPVLLIALIAERIAFKPTKNKRKTRYKLAIALVRTLLDFVLAVFIVLIELAFLIGIDTGGYQGEKAQGYWTIVILILIVILYRWFLLSPSVQYAFSTFTDWYFRQIGRFMRWVLARFPDSFVNPLIAGTSAVADILVSGVLYVSRFSAKRR